MSNTEKFNNNAAEILMKAFEEQTNALLYNLRPDVIEQKKRIEKQRASCPYIEWEQDMGKTIPCCKLYKSNCNGQCTFKEE